jgi:hypothetical protein
MLTTLFPTLELAGALLLVASLFLAPLRKVARVLGYFSLLCAHAMMAAWTDDGRWFLLGTCIIALHHAFCDQAWQLRRNPTAASSNYGLALLVGGLSLVLVYTTLRHDLPQLAAPRLSLVDKFISITKLHQGWRFQVNPSARYGLQRWQLHLVLAPSNHTVATANTADLEHYDLLGYTHTGRLEAAVAEASVSPWRAGSQWTQVLLTLANADFQAHDRFSKQLKHKLCGDVVRLCHARHSTDDDGFNTLVQRSGIQLRHELGRLVEGDGGEWQYQSIAQVFDVLQICDSLVAPKPPGGVPAP